MNTNELPRSGIGEIKEERDDLTNKVTETVEKSSKISIWMLILLTVILIAIIYLGWFYR